MFGQFLTKIFGSRNQRLLKQYNKAINKINSFEEAYKSLTDEELKAKTTEFKERLEKGESEDALLPEAFAAVREILSAGLKGAKVDTIKQNKILKIKMPDRATSSIHKGTTGMEFTVDVESKN